MDKAGVSQREVLERALEKARKRKDREKVEALEAELQITPLPPALEYLWAIFHRLRRRKGEGLNGPLPVEWADIDAFLRMSGTRLAPWEVGLVEDLDDLYLQKCAEHARQ